MGGLWGSISIGSRPVSIGAVEEWMANAIEIGLRLYQHPCTTPVRIPLFAVCGVGSRTVSVDNALLAIKPFLL